MGAPSLAPPPIRTPLAQAGGLTSETWSRWLQQVQSILSGANAASDWKTPTLNSGWANVTGYAAQYRRDPITGAVWVQAYATANASGVAFTLPAGFRPKQQKNFATFIDDGSSTGALGRLTVGTNGDVSINLLVTPGSAVSLDCSFLADG